MIGFSQNNYMVNENDGSATLTVAIATGTIDQGLTVTVNFFTTFTFSAAGEWLCVGVVYTYNLLHHHTVTS